MFGTHVFPSFSSSPQLDDISRGFPKDQRLANATSSTKAPCEKNKKFYLSILQETKHRKRPISDLSKSLCKRYSRSFLDILTRENHPSSSISASAPSLAAHLQPSHGDGSASTTCEEEVRLSGARASRVAFAGEKEKPF